MQNRIREIRKALGLTMKELGAKVDVAESTISQYETGKRQPDNETLLKLGEALDVSVGYLLGVEPKEGERLAGKETQLSDRALMFALFGDAEDISDTDLEDVKKYAAFIAERKKKGK